MQRRQMNANMNNVSPEIIYEYFADLSHLIQHIIIDDDQQIQLIGNINGTINGGPMPIIGWKYYWFGKYRIVDYLYHNYPNKDEFVINCRFDVMENSNNIDEKTIISFAINTYKLTDSITKNIFMYKDERHFGIDNIYMGNITTMNKLASLFHFHLDQILAKNTNTIHQEFLVFRINETIKN